MPQVAVVMSVYEKVDPLQLEKAVSSILEQTFRDFEFLIVADGLLTQHQKETLERYVRSDRRVKLLQNDRQMGLAFSMNSAISSSCSAYIARMDADDLSLPGRLATQLAFLEEHDEIDLVGTFAYEIDECDKITFLKSLPILPEQLVLFLGRRDPFVHPTVLFRRSFFEKVGLYNPELSVNQDTELWCRAFRMGVQGANIPAFLYMFRVAKDFYSRRRGLSYALQEVSLRWNYLRDSRVPSYYYAYPLLTFFARMAPRFALKTLYRLAR